MPDDIPSLYPAWVNEMDGEFVITLPDWPEVAAGAESFEAALDDATGALEEASLARLARGEHPPRPSKRKPGQTEIGLSPFAMLKIALNLWVDEQGRGAQAELVRRSGLDKKSVAQALSLQRGKVSTDRLVRLANAAGFTVGTQLYLASPAGRVLGAPGSVPKSHARRAGSVKVS